jgi:hypothetical protein
MSNVTQPTPSTIDLGPGVRLVGEMRIEEPAPRRAVCTA